MAYENSPSNRYENVVESGRIVYVEPNNLTERTVYNPEEYSIFVDLMVETTDRYTRKKIQNEARWVGDSLVFSGSKITSTEKRYLSTNVLNTTYYDVKDGHNDEGLCIDSIDIAYNSWNFPEVNIKFTDVRGVSLLSPSDYFHSNATDVEINGNEKDKKKKNEERDQFTDSLVSSFFKFPYPRYRLSVKGFYGKPATYQLCITDFKTAFNSTTGNFDINVKFVGYMFGFFTDIPMNYLFGAPYTPGKDGADYWDKRDFRFETGEKIPKFGELEKRLHDLNRNLESDGYYQRAQSEKERLNSEKEKIGEMKTAYEEMINSFARIELEVGEDTLSNDTGSRSEKKKWYVLLAPSRKRIGVWDAVPVAMGVNSCNVFLPDYCNDKVDYLCRFEDYAGKYAVPYLTSIIKSFKNTSEVGTGKKKNKIIYKAEPLFSSLYSVDRDSKGIINLNRISTSKEKTPNFSRSENAWKWVYNTLPKTTKGATFNISGAKVKYDGKTIPEWVGTETEKGDSEMNGLFGLLICDTDIRKEFESIESQKEIDRQITEGKIEKITNERISKLLGFVPTIKNIIDITLAHLDVGLNILNAKIDEIYNDPTRINASAYGLTPENSDINTKKSEKTFVPPFFTYYNDIVDNKGITSFDTVTKRQEVWIGSVDKLKNLTEVNIVRNYLEGLIGSSSELDGLKNQLASFAADNTPMLQYLLPTDVLYYVNGKNPYMNVLGGEMDAASFLPALKKLFLYRLFVYEFFRGVGGVYNSAGEQSEYSAVANVESLAFMKTAGFDEMGPQLLKVLENTKGKFFNGLSVDFANIADKTVARFTKERILPTPETLLDITDEKVLGNNLSIVISGGTQDEESQFNINTDNNETGFKEISECIKTKYYGAVTHGYLNRSVDDRVENDGDDVWKKFFNNKYIYKNSDENTITPLPFAKVTILYDNKVNINKMDDVLSAVDRCGFKKYEYKPIDDTVYLPFFALTRRQTLSNSNLVKENLSDADTRKAAYLFLNALPLNYRVFVNRVIKNTYFWKKPMIASIPKALVLLTGALLWRKSIAGTEADIKWAKEFKAPAANQMPRGKSAPFMLLLSPKDKELYQEFDDSWMTDEIKNKFISIFSNWVNEENGDWKKIYAAYFKRTATNVFALENQKTKKIWVNSNTSPYMKCVSDLLTTEWTLNILHPVSYLYDTVKHSVPILKKSLVNSVWDSFVDKIVLQKGKIKEEKKQLEEKIEETKPDKLNDNIYLSAYNLFKGLVNKWLLAMDSERVKYHNGKKEGIANCFRYTNSYCEDIGQKLLINVSELKNLIVMAKTKKLPSMSMYEFMYNLGAQNGMQLLALPTQANLGLSNVQEFIDVFSPLSFADSIGNGDCFELENTYVFTYSERASSKAGYENDEHGQYGYKADTFCFVGPNGTINSAEEIPKTFTKTGGVNEKAYCFAVTFAKDNQSYFKNIQVSMDNPKMTDTAIATTVELSERFASKPNTQLVAYGQDLFSIYSEYSYQCTVDMMGCARIMPLMYFQLNNMPLFKGVYQIFNVKHHIKPGDMTTTFTGQRISRNRTKYNENLGDIVPAKSSDGSDGRKEGKVSVGIGRGGTSNSPRMTSGRELSNDEIQAYKVVCKYAGIDTGIVNQCKMASLRMALTNLDNGILSVDNQIVPRQRFDPYTAYQNNGGQKIRINGVTSRSYLYDEDFKCNSSEDCISKIGAVTGVGSKIGKECAYYGIWFIPGGDFKSCGAKTIDDFIREEAKGIYTQSSHFGTLLKEKGLVSFINANDWSNFIKGYFHLEEGVDKKKYLYASKGQTETGFVAQLAKVIEDNVSKLIESSKNRNSIIYSGPVFDNNDTIPRFDVQAAIRWLYNNSYNEHFDGESEITHTACGKTVAKCGLCARFTTAAMAAGGIKRTGNYDDDAAKLLPKFTGTTACIIIGDDVYAPSQLWADITDDVITKPSDLNISPVGCEPGDICIFESSEKHPYGHMCMYLGIYGSKQLWASDYKHQGLWHGMLSANMDIKKCHIFRYKNRASGSNTPGTQQC